MSCFDFIIQHNYTICYTIIQQNRLYVQRKSFLHILHIQFSLSASKCLVSAVCKDSGDMPDTGHELLIVCWSILTRHLFRFNSSIQLKTPGGENETKCYQRRHVWRRGGQSVKTSDIHTFISTSQSTCSRCRLCETAGRGGRGCRPPIESACWPHHHIQR